MHSIYFFFLFSVIVCRGFSSVVPQKAFYGVLFGIKDLLLHQDLHLFGMYRGKLTWLLHGFVLSLLLAACSSSASDRRKQAELCAQRFLEAFYSFDFDKALELSTDDSHYWILLYASNLTRDDVEQIQQLTSLPVVTVDHLESVGEGDSILSAHCTVEHAFVADTIGVRGRDVSHKEVFLSLKQMKNGWKVRMAGRLQSGT